MAAKNLYEKDLYKILGVSKNDDPAAIKKAYRKLAKDLHPDKTKGDKKLEDRFKEVSEAYEVLSDEKKRAEYEEMRDAFSTGRMPHGGAGQGGGFPGGFQSGGFEDIFGGSQSDFFATLFGGGQRGPRKGQDLQTETTISFRDSIFGREINLRVNDQTITTRVPAGIKDGAKIKLKGRGAPGQGGPGDLYIVIHVTKHPVYTRDGNNLLMTLPVTFTEAVLGADISVPTLSGEDVKVRLAPGTPNGKVLRVKGRGITSNSHSGDLMITVEVHVPQRIENEAKDALMKYAELTAKETPRQHLKERAGA